MQGSRRAVERINVDIAGIVIPHKKGRARGIRRDSVRIAISAPATRRDTEGANDRREVGAVISENLNHLILADGGEKGGPGGIGGHRNGAGEAGSMPWSRGDFSQVGIGRSSDEIGSIKIRDENGGTYRIDGIPFSRPKGGGRAGIRVTTAAGPPLGDGCAGTGKDLNLAGLVREKRRARGIHR